MAKQSTTPAVCSWSLIPRNPDDLVSQLTSCSANKTQLALVPLVLDPKTWNSAQAKLKSAGIEIVSGMLGTIGEDYSTLTSIQRTGGFVPDANWEANLNRAMQVASVAQQMGLRQVSCHAGFIPPDQSDPTYTKLTTRLRTVADRFADSGLDLLLETGQETAETLSTFLDQLDRKNVGVNFDPANMILYNKGDPIASLKKLLSRVRQVHIKDARRTKITGEWGDEVPVGQGEVDWPAFVRVLKDANFNGYLVVEREAGANRIAEIRSAIELIEKLWPR